MNRRKTTITVLGLLVGAASPAAFSPVYAQTIQPGTALAVQTVAKLREAATIDDNKAMGHTAEDSDVGIYYHDKAKAARELADKLASGQAIDSSEVDHALNNQGAVKYSPNY
ncbi:MAG TPA: hypothetical protein VJN94_07595 [Candidatus Binataceae bacterium]|nr:hypothetical protein [Candidatus Binataceae bacterium]